MPRNFYKPLEEGEIRVLRLKPGVNDEPLVGSLERVLLDRTNYQAISYAWGEPVFIRSIYIDSEEFRVTDSLFGALPRFREPRRDVHLWADQLCIDQSDVEEKNAQVAMMAKIFGGAREVYVWLGTPDEHHDTAFAMMTFLAGPWWSTAIQELHRRPTVTEVRRRWKDHNPNVTLEDGLIAFSTIARKRWFERLWVVQELLAGEHQDASFYCGEYSILWSSAVAAFQKFIDVIKFKVLSGIDASSEKRIIDLYGPNFFNESFGMTSRASRFLKVLFETAHLKTSEPRDRVYALMSIAIMDEREEIKVNYAIEMPDLWRLVARFLLRTAVICEMRALVLALPATQSDTAEVRSSWSTDFNALTPESQRKRMWYRSEMERCSASGESFSRADFVPGREEIDVWSCYGVRLGQVHSILEESNIPVLPSAFFSAQDLVELASRLFDLYLACLKFSRNAVHNFRRDGFVDLLKQGTSQQNPVRYRISLREALGMALERNLVSVSSEENIDDIVDQLCDLPLTEGVSYMDHSRLLASTTNEYLGWVPKQAKAGDHVCLLKGGLAPFIIRELGNGYYVIVGDAYIQGVVHENEWWTNVSEVGILQFK
jgi:hypothetical protein